MFVYNVMCALILILSNNIIFVIINKPNYMHVCTYVHNTFNTTVLHYELEDFNKLDLDINQMVICTVTTHHPYNKGSINGNEQT